VNLTPYTGPNPITTSGTVIDGKDFGIGNTVDIAASNVVIRNSRMGVVNLQSGSNLQVSYSTIDGAASGCNGGDAVQYGDYSLDHVEVVHFSDGPRVSGNNVSITNSFIQVCYNAGDHADGIQGYGGGTNISIRHNSISSTNPTSGNAAIFFADYSKGATIDNNYLSGGQYVLQPLTETDGTGAFTVTNNVIAKGTWDFGPCRITMASKVSWSGNVLDSGTGLAESSC